MTTEPSDRTIILHLLRGAVPERADEISSLWSQYGHAVEVVPSTNRLLLWLPPVVQEISDRLSM